jgi:hypothetical protein
MNYKEKNTTHIDNLTGEVMYSETLVEYEKKLPNEPAYIKLYTDDVGSLFGLSASATNVLLCLASMADYESEVVLTRGVKERIAHKIGSKKNDSGKPSLSAVNNAITDMIKAGIISRIGDAGSGIYQLNPNLFARGKWRDIYYKRKDFKLTITYKNDGTERKREVITEQIGADILQFPAADGETS